MEEIWERCRQDPTFQARAEAALKRFRAYLTGEAPAPKLWLPEECSEDQSMGMRIEMGFWFMTVLQCSKLYAKTPELLGRRVIMVPSVFGGMQKGILARTAHGDPVDLFQRLTLFWSSSTGHTKLFTHAALEVRKGQGQDMFSYRCNKRVKLQPEDACRQGGRGDRQTEAGRLRQEAGRWRREKGWCWGGGRK